MNSESHSGLQEELIVLRQRLQEAEDTLYAIRGGEVDAVVVDSMQGHQVYTLESPDQPFRVFVEQMQEGALTLNRDGVVIYCNGFFTRLVGQPEELVRGQHFQNFLEDAGDFPDLMAAAPAGVVRTESVLLGPDSRRIPVQLAFNCLPSEDTPMFGLVVSDLSERERAMQLETERLAAEEARAARDKFLAIVSHELRTPLNAMLGWIQMLSRQKDCPASVKEGLAVIERNAWAQSQLIEDLLDVSRALAGKLRIVLEPVHLVQTVMSSITTIQPIATRKHIRIVQEFEDHGYVVRGDPDRLHQIVGNLLSNAVKFTPEGGEIRVSVGGMGDLVQVRIRDSGIGIPEDFLPRLFTLFQQNESSTTRRNGGLGLGLAIVKELTELHGGEVFAESEGEGRGATFCVRLPLASMGAVNQDEGRTVPVEDLVPLDGIRVLLVEDDDAARSILGKALKECRAEVTAVANAPDALRLLERQQVDVLVSDIGLPEMDGYELIRRIRATGLSGRQLPAIALTAFAAREDRRQALQAGYQVHIGKPADQFELASVIANLASMSVPH